MPTNEERREVAARLRELDTSRLYDGMDEVCALEDACGCDVGQDWQDMELKDRLAELIEPEPERTCAECRHYFGFGTVFGDVPRCAECVDAITSLPRPCEEVRGCKRCNKSARKRDSDDKHD